MKLYRHATALVCAAALLTGNAAAESQESLRASLQEALTANDLDAALELSADLYDAALAETDASGAGAAAYSRAEILTAQESHDDSAAYALCEDHYQSVSAAAQSLQCAFKAATALQSAGRPGTGLDKLQAVENELKAIGQERSGFAVGVYLALAEATLPSEFDREVGARSKRNRVIAYTEEAATLEAIGKADSHYFTSALLMKAEALDHLKDYEKSVTTYETFLELYEALPNHSNDVLQNAYERYNIARLETKDDPNTLKVTGKNDEEIILTVQKKRKVRTPKLNGNQVIDGAYADALITLDADGGVETIEILASEPDPKYGEALRKGVKHWRFIPPEGVSGAVIPPFEYGMVFYVTRRD